MKYFKFGGGGVLTIKDWALSEHSKSCNEVCCLKGGHGQCLWCY